MSTKKRIPPVYVGLSVTRYAIEVASFSAKSFAVERSVSVATPEGLLDESGDRILDEALMQAVLEQLFAQFGSRPKQIHLSLPATLLRMVDMQRMGVNELYLALSSEAERYKAFDQTEAAVDFAVLEESASEQRLLLGALRNDTLTQYARVLQSLKVKLASVGMESMNVLRGMAGSGVLDSLVSQIGLESPWGLITVEPERVRISLWRGNTLLDMRETHMSTREFETATEHSMVVDDLVEEIRRSCKAEAPVVWLSYCMPPEMAAQLTQRLGTPVTPCMLGETLAVDQPYLTLPAVGCAMTSVVAFPFEFNILGGAGKVETKFASNASESFEPDNQAGSNLIKLGVGSIAAGLLISAALFGANEFWAKGEVSRAQDRQAQLSQEISSLQARRDIMKSQSELHKALLTMVNNARVRNQVYVRLTDDLQEKTPNNLWIHTMKVGDQIELSGNALAHQSVINFARSFDGLPYLSSVMIDAIKENFIAGTTLFDFKIGGNVVLNESLLEPLDGFPEEGSTLEHVVQDEGPT